MLKKEKIIKGEDRPTFPLRLPKEMHKRLKLLAVEGNTTMNELIICAIEQAYPLKRKNGRNT